jgi:3-oxoacyl-[acyl-carrier-protein] synthase II
MQIGIAGLGLVSRLGDAGDVRRLLIEKAWLDRRELPADHTLELARLSDYDLPQSLLRRMSHFAKIALLSACRAVDDFGRDLAESSVGIIQGSVYGPIISGIQAFDDLIDFGDNQLSPTNFSGSVFNTSATYLSLAFGIQGSTLAHTGGLDTLYNSLMVASMWLESGAAEYVIMGIGDEFCPYFERGGGSTDRPAGLLPNSEGWTTFILCKEPDAKYGQVAYESISALPEDQNRPNIYSVWHEQIDAPEFREHARDNRACFPVWLRGAYPCGAAFDLALALLCAQNGRFPVVDDAVGIYRIQALNQGERINCYSMAEIRGAVCYSVTC